MKTKINKTRKQGWITLIALVIIAFAIYIGFSPLFELIQGGIAGRVLGSSFGAIFVIILTMFLLNKQTEIEQEKKYFPTWFQSQGGEEALRASFEAAVKKKFCSLDDKKILSSGVLDTVFQEFVGDSKDWVL